MSSRAEQIDGMANYIAERLEAPLKLALRNATKCCPNCEHFKPEPVLRCGLNNMQPPSTVIAFGCECFKDNECPF